VSTLDTRLSRSSHFPFGIRLGPHARAMTRKEFLATSLVVPGMLTASRLTAAEAADAGVTPETGRGPGRGPRQPLGRVLEFVQAGHGDLAKVQGMLAADPALVHARWDWGDGDWESALEGAAHMGRADIVRHLLVSGARVDILTAAMLGDAATVGSLVKLEPAHGRGGGTAAP
jgi:hypothetical protein